MNEPNKPPKTKTKNANHHQEAGHEDLTDAVYREALRRGALDGYWSTGKEGRKEEEGAL
jgi:hypothetical protein